MEAKIICHLVKSVRVHDTGISIARSVSSKVEGVYVSLIRPGDSVLSELRSRRVDVSKWCVIDCFGSKSDKSVISVHSAEAVTELSIVISQSLQSFEGHSVLIFEGLNSLVTSNGVLVAQKFIQFLVGKLRSWGVKAHFVVSTDIDPSLITLFRQISDSVKKD